MIVVAVFMRTLLRPLQFFSQQLVEFESKRNFLKCSPASPSVSAAIMYESKREGERKREQKVCALRERAEHKTIFRNSFVCVMPAQHGAGREIKREREREGTVCVHALSCKTAHTSDAAFALHQLIAAC